MLHLETKVEQDSLINDHLAKLVRILRNISIPNEFELWLCQSINGSYYLQIQFWDNCNYSGTSDYRAYCRKWMIERDEMGDEAHIVRTCWKAYEAALMHEASEKFTYKGKRVFDPHSINLT